MLAVADSGYHPELYFKLKSSFLFEMIKVRDTRVWTRQWPDHSYRSVVVLRDSSDHAAGPAPRPPLATLLMLWEPVALFPKQPLVELVVVVVEASLWSAVTLQSLLCSYTQLSDEW